jgi:hypothetical protein
MRTHTLTLPHILYTYCACLCRKFIEAKDAAEKMRSEQDDLRRRRDVSPRHSLPLSLSLSLSLSLHPFLFSSTTVLLLSFSQPQRERGEGQGQDVRVDGSLAQYQREET